ncbi:MAG: restriction endonuclease subunit S [Patescibacteria group bacterium]
MITYSIIQKSQLEGALRIDAEYYQPEYLEIVSKVSKIPHDTLENISESLLSFGAYSLTSFIQWKESGIPFITAEDVKEGFINLENARFIDEKVNEILKKSRVHENEVLLAMSGKVGDAAVVVDIPSRLNSNQDIVKIKLKKEYSPYFLAVFLNSKFGRLQVLRLPVGSVQQHIFLWQTKSLLIPKFPKTFVVNIENLYKSALNEFQDSKTFYKQAEDLLLEELGLKNTVFEDQLSYIVNFSDVTSNNRIDPEYFQPKYQKLIEKIKGQNAKILGELVSMRKGFEPGSEAYQEEGKLFIRVSSVSKLGIEEKDQKYLSEELYQALKKDFEPQLGDILLTKDATPGIAYVIKEPLEGIISGGILDLKVKDNIESEYLALCISSIVGQWQAQRDAGGSIIAHWKPEQVKNLIIPILPNDTQEKIAELVRKSHEARKKSKELLDQAKKEVEEMIEKGGEN